MTTHLHVVGARPNFMKVAPVLAAGRQRPDLRQVLVHTGQHYDQAMSDAFFAELDLPEPDEHLGAGSGTHAEQTARIMLAFEPVVERYRPDWVVVYGDVNSTIACALVAAKKGIPVAHVEAGLRSRDRSMPEELNRLLTDQLAELLLTPSADADQNLRAEGIPVERIRCVGNVMVATLDRLRPLATARRAPEALGVAEGPYAFVTLHRPSNVDARATLEEILRALEHTARRLPVVFAVHPRTRTRIVEFGLQDVAPSVMAVDPLGYLDTISLVERAALVITDSGGLQEETTVLGVPCLTVRPNTERPITLTMGTNQLVASNTAALLSAIGPVLDGEGNGAASRSRPPLWDADVGERIVAALLGAR